VQNLVNRQKPPDPSRAQRTRLVLCHPERSRGTLRLPPPRTQTHVVGGRNKSGVPHLSRIFAKGGSLRLNHQGTSPNACHPEAHALRGQVRNFGRGWMLGVVEMIPVLILRIKRRWAANSFILTSGLPTARMAGRDLVRTSPNDAVQMKARFPGCVVLVIIGLGLLSGTPARAQTFSALYSFGTNSADPTSPQYPGLVAQGRDGNLYTTGTDGGANGLGAVFAITTTGKLSVLYSFDGTHGSNPDSGLTLGTDGNFYGTTKSGGTFGAGTVFKIAPTGNLTVLYNFSGGSDGGYPDAPPIQAADGNFYGTTTHGGTIFGTVYKMTQAGILTTLYTFDQTPHGSFPIAPLVQGSDGNFYGMTETGGGTAGDGAIYKITAGGTLTVLYDFDGTHGSGPTDPLVQGSDGNYYGTTSGGGSFGYGVAFKITPTGTLTVLHNMNGTSEGGYPEGGLTQAADGAFYGVNSGGASDKDYGTIFTLNVKGSFSILHKFDFAAGARPYSTLLQHTKGNLYGDTSRGGAGTGCFDNCGIFYGLKVGLKPFVSLVPTSGKVGKTVEILGQGFKGTTEVSFNGTPATFKVVSNTYLTAKVPRGATTGFVTVTTPKRKLTSNRKFRVN
jgi:uncharacterized repeat protein (TIGR03803 family)